MGIMNYTNIEIRNGNEYRMLINNKIYDKSMFFYPVFKKSVEIIREICSCDRDYCGEQFALYYPNNIIMYCAERGGGKSSAMISFAAALKHLGCSDKKNEEDFNEFWGDIPANYSFSVLDVIDPTTIFEKEIFMRIVSQKCFPNSGHYGRTRTRNHAVIIAIISIGTKSWKNSENAMDLLI